MKLDLKRQKMLLAGEWTDREETIDVRNPENDDLIATVPLASIDDMEKAIQLAKKGAIVSSNLPVHKRMSILNKAADYVLAHVEEYAKTIALEGSKTIREARKEASRCVETLRLSAEEARRITGETIPFDQSPGGEGRLGYYESGPIGIIGAITPFNDPLNLVAHKIGPAIAAGNAIIVKPASITPLSALFLAEAFTHAELPNGILSVLTGPGSVIGDYLMTHPAVRMISFTGGMEAGLTIAKKAGLKKKSMELGSNSPVIVLNDADIEEAVASCVSGAFWAAGQNCIGVQRMYVQEDVYAEFKQQFVQQAKAYKVGFKLDKQTDMGPLISETEAKRVEFIVDDAVRSGALLLCGGNRTEAFYEPTVLENVPSDCHLGNEEIFGPVALLYKINSLEQAIHEANQTEYGLQAGLFTKDLNVAFKVIRELNVGGIMINDSSDFRIDAMPFGGTKQSGLGREGVRFAVQEMTEQKVVCFKMG
ncbi:glyceraldehyde-3-phosphate dehydrogenase (NADP+) [Alkalihalobacillus xiaoxiensis]|uniref:Glyceraldehyde-3-phosphate dehydrogenase (NADP+) n=1 Tax=Shouchella xiaoxiensis TaxID=766895 RepID=A0ABS2T0D5_9BACI|nr:aldehyde dehydrogenase family protein [Shouchella xiaoxiensis]MBM7841251.1 glyceraldehyde-3-phosphate dehydrogenase (NADP+) [Shouchella xiaoxiensis]